MTFTPEKRSVGSETIKNIKIFYESLRKYLYADASCIPEALSISNKAHSETINSFFKVIRSSDEITIQEACDTLGLSTSYVARVFKSTFGITPRQYSNIFKINKSLSAIKGDLVNLSTVSLDMGFSDQSHFTNVFKRFMQITPGDLHKGTSFLL
jgi:AraC-like DNA-binding protein